DPSAGKGPKSTPAVDGDRLYAYGVAGMLHCLDVKTGNVLWKHDCAAEYWGVKKDKDGDDAWCTPCGAASSPLADGKRVLLSTGGEKCGSVSGFDRDSGKLVWKALDDKGSYASPVVAQLAGQRQVVAFTGLRMVGVKASDGALLWEHPFEAMFQQT